MKILYFPFFQESIVFIRFPNRSQGTLTWIKDKSENLEVYNRTQAAELLVEET